MELTIKCFKTHKLAETPADCQDYYDVNPEARRYAISDGVSQSVFPQAWAKILTQAYATEGWDGTENGLLALQERWQNDAKDRLDEQKKKGKNPWRLQNSLNLRNGGCATLCAITINDDGEWDGLVLGDSCLIEIDERYHITRILKSQEGEFSNMPEYYDSFNGIKGNIKRIQGKLAANGYIIMATDAISELLYKKQAASSEDEFVKRLLSIPENDKDAFEKLVDDWRAKENMHNDDSTVIIISVANTQSPKNQEPKVADDSSESPATDDGGEVPATDEEDDEEKTNIINNIIKILKANAYVILPIAICLIFSIFTARCTPTYSH